MSVIGSYGRLYSDPVARSRRARTSSELIGPTELVTDSTIWPVTYEELKEQGIIEVDDDVKLLNRLIRAATEYCEMDANGGRSNRFTTATWDVPVRDWWYCPLVMPKPPLQSVTSVSYYDSTGTVQTIASTLYVVKTPYRQPGTITRAPNQNWPSAQSDREFPITVRIVAGWASAAAVPETIKHAILMLAAHWHRNRDSIGTVTDDIERTVSRLLLQTSTGSYQ